MKARKAAQPYVSHLRHIIYDEKNSAKTLVIDLDWSQEIHRKVCLLQERTTINATNHNLYLSDFDTLRKSEYYLNLKTRLLHGDKLDGYDFFYFVMITDDINHLDLTMLEQLEEQFKYEEFLPNFNIILAIRRWQEETNPVKKVRLNEKLREAINARGNLPFDHQLQYLNLHGVNLAGADLSQTKLHHVDLTGASLHDCKLDGMHIHFACLDHANLSHATIAGGHSSFITDSSAKHACFDGVTVENARWDRSQFNNSSFKHAVINGVKANYTVLNNCDFTNATLRLKENYHCELRHVNLTGCTFACPDIYTMYDERIFSEYALFNLAYLNQELDGIQQHIMHESPASQHATYQDIIARNLIHVLNQSHLNSDEKIALINTALDHDIFLPEGPYSQLAYRTERSIYGFFTNQPHEYFSTSAQRVLEDKRDSLISSRENLIKSF